MKKRIATRNVKKTLISYNHSIKINNKGTRKTFIAHYKIFLYRLLMLHSVIKSIVDNKER